jgi:hypothetical protein
MAVIVAGLTAGVHLGAAADARTGPRFASWADSKHGFATDPVHLAGGRVRWRCTRPRLRPRRTDLVLCATDDGGKHWRRSFSGMVHGKGDTTIVGPVLRWSARDGVRADYVRSELYPGHWGADAGEYVTHDGGRTWHVTDAFLGTYRRDCNGLDPVRACRVVYLGGHEPEPLRYGLRVCEAGSGCTTRFFRLDGWPEGPLTAVPDE